VSSNDDTVSELDDLNIVYSRLIMNDGSTADSNAFKKATAAELLKTYDIVLAIENNPDARKGYEDLGIATLDPATIPEITDTPNSTDPMVDEPINRWLKTAHAIVAKLEPVQEVPIPSTRNSKMQTRSQLNCELRAETVGDKLKLTGYAAIFNSRSQNLGGFTEIIAPGAFRKSLQARNDIKLLWNHDTSAPLASTRAGTLRLIEDSKGLKVEADLAPTTLGKDISILVQRGDVSAFSFGFNVIKDSWSNSGTERTLEAVRLFEASLVSFPAYEATTGTATVRGLDADQLAEGLLALENGEELSTELATVLVETVNRLIKEPDVQEVQGDILALKKKKLDLLMKGY
jgi:HK97 family phage prohead protease